MLDWTAVDTVLLDMDGTLLDLAYDNHFWLEHIPKVFAETRGIGLDEAKGQLHAKMSATQGTLEWYCIDHWTDTLGFDVHELPVESIDAQGKFRNLCAGKLPPRRGLGIEAI